MNFENSQNLYGNGNGYGSTATNIIITLLNKMKNYIITYMNFFDYFGEGFMPSEISDSSAVDIHHIICKGIGGTSDKNINCIENLIALTRDEHTKYGDKKKYYIFLINTHIKFIKKENPDYKINYQFYADNGIDVNELIK